MKFFDKKRAIFMGLFVILGLVTLQIKLSNLVGSKVSFTVFDAFGPTAGAFLGPLGGTAAVLLMQVFNFFIHGARVVDAGTYIRFIPPLFAVLYFSRKTKLNILIPLLAIVSFNVNPVGRSVWYYSLYWLIPIVCYFWRDRSLLTKSLGATFTAHAVGGAIWIHVFALPKAVWVGLIPIVAAERLLFAVGIAVMYVLINNLVNVLVQKRFLPEGLPVNPKYVFGKPVHKEPIHG